MIILNKKEVVDKRRKLFNSSGKFVTFKKGDKRVYSPRICVTCSRPLSSLIINQGKYVTSFNHIRFHLGGGITVDICEDINSCHRNLRQKGELEDEDV
ncbi:hypothetical protein BH753_gp099 [Bacillus phage Shbh1]|uniref:Uncharacterized protein n=1 Tax=Bacillus phage Shbh1 TaxID=1796992 RepID=A0A142F1C4_9CAUD|nr:hypothetical protein BH753_gp099 [Bacillus phage Shbh1]AMQ66581.1 hypothetical protein [Bacillus phage Shbh1]